MKILGYVAHLTVEGGAFGFFCIATFSAGGKPVLRKASESREVIHFNMAKLVQYTDDMHCVYAVLYIKVGLWSWSRISCWST